MPVQTLKDKSLRPLKSVWCHNAGVPVLPPHKSKASCVEAMPVLTYHLHASILLHNEVECQVASVSKEYIHRCWHLVYLNSFQYTV